MDKSIEGGKTMDDKMRGVLEKIIDESLEEGILQHIKWLQDAIPISSLMDVAVGYAIGNIATLANVVCQLLTSGKYTPAKEEGDSVETREILKRRLPEILERINREIQQ